MTPRCLCGIVVSTESKNITIKSDTHRALWSLKESPGETYDEIIRELLVEARDVEVRQDE
jgi:predicted CopG family antitoxin